MLKALLQYALVIALWEVLRRAVSGTFKVQMKKYESEDVDIEVDLWLWDRKGIKHFKELGYAIVGKEDQNGEGS